MWEPRKALGERSIVVGRPRRLRNTVVGIAAVGVAVFVAWLAAGGSAEAAVGCTAPPEVLRFQVDRFFVDRDGNAMGGRFLGTIDARGGDGLWTVGPPGTTPQWELGEANGAATVTPDLLPNGKVPGRSYVYELSVKTACGEARRTLSLVWPKQNLRYPYINGTRVSADLNGDGFGEQVSVFDFGAKDRFSSQVMIRDGKSLAVLYDQPLTWKSAGLRARCQFATKVQIGRMSSARTNDVLIVGSGGSERCYRIIHLNGLRADVVFDYAPLPWFANDRNSWGPQTSDRGSSITPIGQDFTWAMPAGLPPSKPRRDMFTIREIELVQCPGACAIAGSLHRTVTYQYLGDQHEFVPTKWAVVFNPI